MLRPKLPFLVFAAILTVVCVRSYRYPEYSPDGFLYMANAVAMSGAGIAQIHDTVYREVRAGVPQPALDHLLGKDPVESSQSKSFHERATNPYRFAEFLPCFAVRPLFTELVYVLHFHLGTTLLHAILLISVLSFWVMGWIVLAWVSRYVEQRWIAMLISVLLLLTPSIVELARSTTPDALSCMVSLLALYLILEKQSLFPGLLLLVLTVYIRTDNVLLVLPTLAWASMRGTGFAKSKAVVLAVVAVGSVVLINHFAGDYGMKLLYYRAFIGTPLAPGELVPQFGLRDYLVALRAGIAGVVHGETVIFALMGVLAMLKQPARAMLGLLAVTTFYAAIHFVIFPLPEARYSAAFFLATGIALASTAVRNTGEQVSSMATTAR